VPEPAAPAPEAKRRAVCSQPADPSTRLLGGVLIGGRSARMRAPKHLLTFGGETFLERIVAALCPHVAEVVLLGVGEVPAQLAHLRRLPDAADAHGPLAGLLAALRCGISLRPVFCTGSGRPLGAAGCVAADRSETRPPPTWVFAPCDVPLLTSDAVAWLIAQRAADRWVVLPRVPGGSASGRSCVEPLLALYEPPALALLEQLVHERRAAPRALAGREHVAVVEPPPHLAHAWRNVNTPADLDDLQRHSAAC